MVIHTEETINITALIKTGFFKHNVNDENITSNTLCRLKGDNGMIP